MGGKRKEKSLRNGGGSRKDLGRTWNSRKPGRVDGFRKVRCMRKGLEAGTYGRKACSLSARASVAHAEQTK